MKILFCSLNWGLGHATRDVPIIDRLLDLGHQVILAGDGAPLELLKTEFPELETLHFRSNLRIRYSRHLPAWLKISLLSPLLLFEILAEHFRLKRIILQTLPDIVISDNRYGLWSRKTKSILITHQLSLRLPRFARFLEYPAYLLLRTIVEQFDRCWIPDYPGEENLSGNLSHRYPLPINAVFIGAVSRLQGQSSANPPAHFEHQQSNSESFHSGAQSFQPPDESPQNPLNLLVLLSGPEPQRSVLQKTILKQLLSINIRCVLLQGLPGKKRRCDITSTVTSYSHLPAAELRNILQSAENVICRAGYTSIMDLALMQKKALIIPTPGQTEQEYLAEYLSEKGMFLTCTQNELKLDESLKNLDAFTPEFTLPEEDFLKNELERL